MEMSLYFEAKVLLDETMNKKKEKGGDEEWVNDLGMFLSEEAYKDTLEELYLTKKILRSVTVSVTFRGRFRLMRR